MSELKWRKLSNGGMYASGERFNFLIHKTPLDKWDLRRHRPEEWLEDSEDARILFAEINGEELGPFERLKDAKARAEEDDTYDPYIIQILPVRGVPNSNGDNLQELLDDCTMKICLAAGIPKNLFKPEEPEPTRVITLDWKFTHETKQL